MRFLDSNDYRNSTGVRLLHTGRKLSRDEGHTIFREMVRAEARNGYLSPLRRRRLVQYAAALQLTPLEASRIVTEISREIAEEFGPPPWHYRMVEAAAPARWPAWIRIALTLAAAITATQLLRSLL